MEKQEFPFMIFITLHNNESTTVKSLKLIFHEYYKSIKNIVVIVVNRYVLVYQNKWLISNLSSSKSINHSLLDKKCKVLCLYNLYIIYTYIVFAMRVFTEYRVKTMNIMYFKEFKANILCWY